MTMLVIIISISACKNLWKKYYKLEENNPGNDTEGFEAVAMVTTIFVALGCLIGAAIIFCQVLDIITCFTFPEKVVLQFIQQYLPN